MGRRDAWQGCEVPHSGCSFSPFFPLGLGSVLLQSCLIPAFCWEEKGMGAAGRGGERREWGFLGLSVIYRSQVWSPRFLGVMV